MAAVRNERVVAASGLSGPMASKRDTDLNGERDSLKEEFAEEREAER